MSCGAFRYKFLSSFLGTLLHGVFLASATHVLNVILREFLTIQSHVRYADDHWSDLKYLYYYPDDSLGSGVDIYIVGMQFSVRTSWS